MADTEGNEEAVNSTSMCLFLAADDSEGTIKEVRGKEVGRNATLLGVFSSAVRP